MGQNRRHIEISICCTIDTLHLAGRLYRVPVAAETSQPDEDADCDCDEDDSEPAVRMGGMMGGRRRRPPQFG